MTGGDIWTDDDVRQVVQVPFLHMIAVDLGSSRPVICVLLIFKYGSNSPILVSASMKGED